MSAADAVSRTSYKGRYTSFARLWVRPEKCQRYFCPAEYTLCQNLRRTLTLTLTLNLDFFFRVRVRVRFCLNGVLRWAKVSLAHFSGHTPCYLVASVRDTVLSNNLKGKHHIVNQ